MIITDNEISLRLLDLIDQYANKLEELKPIIEQLDAQKEVQRKKRAVVNSLKREYEAIVEETQVLENELYNLLNPTTVEDNKKVESENNGTNTGVYTGMEVYTVSLLGASAALFTIAKRKNKIK